MDANKITRQLIRFASISPLRIPQGKSGEWEVAYEIHESGTCLDVVNMRKAFLTGAVPIKVQLAERRIVHKLLCKGDVVMSDLPVEMADHMPFYHKARGNVLVGGLGLGYIATKLLENESVKRIVVVEKESDVIKLIAPHTDRRIEIVRADLFDYLKTEPLDGFTSAYFDIWTSNGEGAWDEYIVPLRRLARRGNPRMRVSCWSEDVIAGQLGNVNGIATGVLFRLAGVDLEKVRYFRPHWVFCKAVKEADIVARPMNLKPMDARELLAAEQANKDNVPLRNLASFYLNAVGTAKWERAFGDLWDRWRRK